MLCCDNVLFVSYLWDAHPVDVPTARVESHGIQKAFVWFKRVVGKNQKQGTICGRPHVVHTVVHSLSEQSNMITTVYECSWATIG